MRWWADEKLSGQYQAIICDGAVRSGKTGVMALSFALWAMENFSDGDFALCGKTIGAVKRNLVGALKKELEGLCTVRQTGSLMELRRGGRVNRFHLFGGRDEGSAALIQGMTLCGVLLDEVALMPRSFVEQALARCSVEGARFWFSCNPQGPGHWFYRE
ncbi:MAG: terminase family protein, partial [Oscillospiraceae bacterium]|nr:terminase family protein [Oscillospiraceae bacterium]